MTEKSVPGKLRNWGNVIPSRDQLVIIGGGAHSGIAFFQGLAKNAAALGLKGFRGTWSMTGLVQGCKEARADGTLVCGPFAARIPSVTCDDSCPKLSSWAATIRRFPGVRQIVAGSTG